jgi:HPt (histidine-containing phosphotransfer) domain-containing protein
MATFRQGPPEMVSFTLGLIDQFIVEAEMRVETLHDATQRHDAAALKAAAHSLKGSSLIMGARRLGALCGQVENGAPVAAVAPELMAAIDRELAQVRTAFIAEREQIHAQGTTRS